MSLRAISRNKLFSIINAIGLSAGLAVALLIFMLVYNALSFDRSFPDHKRIYRINTLWQDHRLGQKTGMSPAGLAAIIEESVPGVERAVRVWHRGHIAKTETFEKDMEVIWAEDDFFELFPAQVLYGSLEAALSTPDGAVLSLTQARAMFGEDDPVGKTMYYGPWEWEVRAVFKDFPTNTSMGYPIYTGFATTGHQNNEDWAQMQINVDTWVILDAVSDPRQVTDRLNEIAADRYSEQGYLFELMPLDDFHLRSTDAESRHLGKDKGDLTQVRMFSILAVVILLIVCINYMNLSTAQAQKRLRVIGLNKILGAQRSAIIWRAYLESAILTFVAFAAAFALFWVLLPDFSNLMGVQLSHAMIREPVFILGLAAIFLFTVLFSASYSAFYLSGFPPTLAVKKGGTTYKVLRETLSVLQFAVAIVLITWVLTIESQTRYIYSKNLGYNPEELVGFWIRTARLETDYVTLEDNLRQLPSVKETSRISNFPWAAEIALRNMRSQEAEAIQMRYISGDEHTIDLFQMELIAGKPLPEPFQPSRNGVGDTLLTAMVNERAVVALGTTPEEIVGQHIYLGDAERPTPLIVCGVVRDFNLETLYRPIAPMAFINMPGGRWYQIVRMSGGSRAENVDGYRRVFEELFPNDMFDPHYIDDELVANYSGVKQTEEITILFTILAIIMACMGVFALTAFLVEQRTKEIGIRRVLGSSIGGVLGLFARTYLRLLAIALVIAVPAGMWVCGNYLSTFAYRISLSWWMFAAAAGITLVLVLIAVVAPTFKAANTDPVKNLRYE